MKKYLLPLFTLLFLLGANLIKAQTYIIGQQEDGFEVWAPDPLNAPAKDPNDQSAGFPAWQCLNPLAAPPFNSGGPPYTPPSVFPDSTIVHSGHYSCRITSVVLNSTGYSYVRSFVKHDTVGAVMLATITGGSPPIVLGVPFAHRIASFSFWYQYAPKVHAGIPDTASCNVVLTHLHHEIGYGSVLLDSVHTWTKEVINITYDSASTPDTINVIFSASSQFAPLPGSTLYIDDASTPLGIDEISMPTASVDVYPNPASSKVNLRISGENAHTVEVFDITGKKINAYSVTNNSVGINTETYTPGLYIYQMYNKDGNLIKVGKFSVAQ